jgi:uncharacterized protein YndB with AHSA1/START domain
MLPVTVSITIDAPRERVFELIGDLAKRPSFTDHFIEQFRLERIPSTGVGAAARFRTGPPGRRLWIETVIEELEPPHRILEGGHGGRWDRIPVGTGWELVAGPGSTTEASLTFWTEPSHPIDRLKEHPGSRGWYRRRWSRALRRMRDLLESDIPVEPLAVAGEDAMPALPPAVRH